MTHIHIPDGVLPAWMWVSGWLLTLALVFIAGKLSSRARVRRKVPLLGIVAAMMLVAMSSEIIPIAYHVNLTVLAGILLGPVLSIIAAFIVEVVLAMLGHGGVTVLGLNTLIIATEMVLGWALFRLIVGALGRNRSGWSAALSTAMTLAVTTTMLVGIVWLAGAGQAGARETGALDPETLSFENPFASGVVTLGLFSGGEDHAHEGEEETHADEHAEEEAHGGEGSHEDEHADEAVLDVRRFAIVVFTLGPIGWLLESAITAGIVRYVARVRPTLIFEGALEETTLRLPGDEAGGM
jgi:cobalt/nickel transport system permease protein